MQRDGTGASPQPPLQRVHILPLGDADSKLDGSSRLDFLAPELRRKRSCQEVVKTGDLVRQCDLTFAIVKCEPPAGSLGPDTNYYLEGDPLVSFDKIQFRAWGPKAMTPTALIQECIATYFKGDFVPYGRDGARRVRLFYTNQIFQIGNVCLQVEATEPGGLGVVTDQTEIFANWDQTPEFEKVHIVPVQDTLPRAYEFDVFQDYIKPYLEANAHKKFYCNELFTYHGVQFKMVACEPDELARIGKSTAIFCEGTAHSTLSDRLSPDFLSRLQQLPPRLQVVLLNEHTAHELENMLPQRRGLVEETLYQIEKFTWPPSEGMVPGTQHKCMVCLGDFRAGDTCRRLPCRHVFHSSCVDEWLRRCTDCPICKDNVDLAIHPEED